jgi:glycine/D-amino acid oxidase-like deaminating enzyme
LGCSNLREIEARIHEFGIDCDWIMSGGIDVAIASYQTADLARLHEQLQEYAIPSELLDSREVRQRVDSPLYTAGLFDPHVAMVNPAELAWGLARVAEQLGVKIYENSPVSSLTDQGSSVAVGVSRGVIKAQTVLLATNAYPPLLSRLRHYLVPVYDYVLMTEPLTADQKQSVNWKGREGMGDSGNQFHYYRMTNTDRILFGGFDAIYHSGNGMKPEFDVDHDCLARLADHFSQTFPQLSSVSFSHGWGGAIDTCSRFSAFWGTAHHGKTAYVAGYTGLGVGASRFGALTCLDLLAGRSTERTELAMVKTKPVPFPPEPFRSIGINWTTRSLHQADLHEGRRNLWLRFLDKFGMGFDS